MTFKEIFQQIFQILPKDHLVKPDITQISDNRGESLTIKYFSSTFLYLNVLISERARVSTLSAEPDL